MDDLSHVSFPAALEAIVRDTEAAGFTWSSAPRTGVLLRALAASKPGGALLELGTGSGVGTAWILDGMDAGSTLDTVDNESALVAVARKHLGSDPRLRLHVADATAFLEGLRGRTFDLVFADTWAGKFHHLDEAMELLAPGGVYVIDDLIPQSGWEDGHARRVDGLIRVLEARRDVHIVKLPWCTGIVLAVKK